MLARALLAATLAIPGATNSGVSVAAAGSDVVAVWAAKSAAGTDIYAAFSRDGGATFDEPVRVNDVAGDARVSGEQPPRVALAAGVVEVVWTSRQGGASFVRSARTRAGEGTFQPAANVHAASLSGMRGWHSLAMAATGAAHAVWLDGRAAPRQDLYQASLRRDGTREETRIAPDVCFCCKTSAAAAADGSLYVAWRHIFPPNVRDIAVARSSDGGRSFSAPVRVSEDDWRIDACPDDGPSLAVDARGSVHVAWPTLVKGAALGKGIFYSYSRDGGKTFTPRLRVDDDAGAAAHPQLAVAGERVLVVWDQAGSPRRVRFREILGGEAPRLAAPEVLSGERSATYPAVAATSKGALVAWTEETPAGGAIRTRLVP